ncbi:MAG: dihydroorotase [Luminiphilus sp.]|jgi:dihydroorotase|tara:strand:- start:1268 stop:2308 length:1041 start_codon:yes stop_codon:yes gene_type:complete
MSRITITKPDDWHIHLRDGDMLERTVNDVAAWANRAVVMPNLSPPVKNIADATAYHSRIMAALEGFPQFEPLMTLYLTDSTTPQDIKAAAESKLVCGVKLYPAGATTNSAAGVTGLETLKPTLEAMQSHDLPLLVHGEVTDPDVDIFDREAKFIERTLAPLTDELPELRIILEHITTEDSVNFVAESRPGVAATITPQHLLFDRNDMLVGGIRPHLFCLPVLKRRQHKEALRRAAISGNPKFFIGTDSAPHTVETKESSCGCAGCYSAHAAIPLYAEVFEEENSLDKLEAFTSHFGADFYGRPRNQETIDLVKVDNLSPESLRFGSSTVVPLRAGELLAWRLEKTP